MCVCIVWYFIDSQSDQFAVDPLWMQIYFCQGHTHSSIYQGFLTRMVYLKYDLSYRYTILVGNPRYVIRLCIATLRIPCSCALFCLFLCCFACLFVCCFYFFVLLTGIHWHSGSPLSHMSNTGISVQLAGWPSLSSSFSHSVLSCLGWDFIWCWSQYLIKWMPW